MTPELKKTIKHIYRVVNQRPTYDRIQDRADLKERLDEVEHHGFIGVQWEATDCDHTHATGGRNRPRLTLVEEQRRRDMFFDDLEGPGCMWYVDPRENITHRTTRDLALEAFEDGHPHLIVGRGRAA